MESIINEFLKSQQRIAKTTWNGNTIWLKQYTPKGRFGFAALRDACARLNNNPLYFSTESTSASQIAGEVRRLYYLRSKGVRVPKVLAHNKYWLVMTDNGDSLRSLLHDGRLPEADKLNLLINASTALGRLHQQGMWHGRPALRDLTWDGAHIGFLDFEEDLAKKLTLEQCQVRDILVFLHNVVRYNPLTQWSAQHVLRTCMLAYQREAPPVIWEQATKTVHSMWLIYFTLWLTQPVNGKDGRAALHTLRFMTSGHTRTWRRALFCLALIGKLLLLNGWVA